MNPEQAVIVPTVLAFGVLVSLLTLARDAVRLLRGPGWMSRRCGLQGRATMLVALDGRQAAAEDLVGLRSRRWYLVVGTANALLAIYLLLGSWGNFAGWRGWAENVSWFFVVMLCGVAAFALIGATALVVALRYGGSPPWTRTVLARTALGEPPDRPSIETTVVEHPAHVRRTHRPPPVRPLGPHHVTDAVARTARATASAWTLLAVSTLGWLTLQRRMPTTPEELDAAIANPTWIGLVVLLAIGALTVYRFEIAGGTIMAVAAAGLAVLSSIQYPPGVALLVAAVFALPALLHWLAWQRDHHVHHLVRVTALTVLLLMGVYLGAERVHAHFFGPTHPASTVVAPPETPVEWAWAGGTTARSTTVVARLHREHDSVRLVVATTPALDDAVRSEPVPADDAGQRVVRLTVDGLRPDTRYHWAIEIDGVVDEVRTGRVRTMPEGPSSFTLAVAACARSGSNGAVFDAIREREPLAYVQLGDFHYANIGVDSQDRFRDALQLTLTRPGQDALYRSTSIAYTWDDHDYAANDGDATSPSRPAAGSVYRSWVPYHPLLSDQPTGPISQSFVAGRVRVVVTDTRSQRTPPGSASGDAQQMMGPAQEAWFAEQLAAARRDGQVVLWAGSTPWIGPAVTSGDTWAGYADARRRVADLIVAAGVQDRLVMLAGDAHMVALDDGTNTDYSTAQAGGFPLLQAAALDRPGSVKGGPYSGGTYPGGGRYGEVEVRDEGGPTLTVVLRGRTWDGVTLVEQTFTLPVGTLPVG